jgi:hypothetical protein
MACHLVGARQQPDPAIPRLTARALVRSFRAPYEEMRMATKEALTPGLIDKRVVERNIKKGLVSREAFDKHLTALPDVADAAETIKARLGEDEEPEMDDEEDDAVDSAEEPGDDAG